MLDSAWHYLADESRHRRVLAALTICLAVAHVAGTWWTARPRNSFVRGDARAYFAYLPSFVVDRDLDLRNQFAVLQPEGSNVVPFGEARRGGASNPFPATPALLWLPGYLAGLVVDTILLARGVGASPLGYGAGAVLGAAIWSIVLTGVAAELTRRLVRESIGPDVALIATGLAWLATSAVYYTAISPLYSHGVAWFAVSLALWLTWKATRPAARMRDVLWAGAAAGVMVGVRLQDATLLAAPVAMLMARYGSTLAAATRVAAAWSAGVTLGVLPQVLIWLRLEGTTLPFGSVGLQALSLDNAAGVLFSMGYRGWISWTPIVAPALVGLGLAAKRAASPEARRLALFGLLGIGAMYLLDVVHPFGAGAAFGGRRYVSATPFVAVGLAACLSPLSGDRVRRVGVAAGLFAMLLVWNGWLLASYELLTLRHALRPTLLETARYGVGLGRP